MLQKALDALNAAFEADPAAVYALICNRVPCNAQLAAHPTVQVGNVPGEPEMFHVGLLGFLNGAIEPITGERVAVRYGAPGEDGTRRMLGFCRYEVKP